ncbi:MAG: peptidyl-tRNA hydrolase Pth2 [Candidatus Methanomethylicaceae archaeon]|nr:peptidyl-tRNA hydrolase Pth2 [Candidatus Verstraetearchaeota archaeon]
MEFEYKQAIVVRQDLKMTKGKLAAQVAHASLSSYLVAKNIRPDWASDWLKEGQKKVVLKTRTLDELLDIKKSADRENIPNSLISDAGLTQLEPGTVTCIGIGPAPAGLVDKIVGHLKLL